MKLKINFGIFIPKMYSVVDKLSLRIPVLGLYHVKYIMVIDKTRCSPSHQSFHIAKTPKLNCITGEMT